MHLPKYICIYLVYLNLSKSYMTFLTGALDLRFVMGGMGRVAASINELLKVCGATRMSGRKILSKAQRYVPKQICGRTSKV